ncbi:MAG: tRNA adenosine(34) deaminase TadA [Clostridia bacterium]|nr:tRNA adenosine(34) deaminase TadA [Clostridia bacterium]
MGDEAWMAEALHEAELAASEGEIPVGCVIVRGDQIISRGHNLREQRGDPTAHAEVVAIRRAAQALGCWKLTGCALYVTLEPCPMCAGAISQARVERLIYGASDPAYGCAGSVYRIPEDPAFNHFCTCDGGVREADCRALLEDFFLHRRQ